MKESSHVWIIIIIFYAVKYENIELQEDGGWVEEGQEMIAEISLHIIVNGNPHKFKWRSLSKKALSFWSSHVVEIW
jgi:hypothetical protein